MIVGAIAGTAPHVNLTLTTPAPSRVEKTAHELALATPDRKPSPLTTTELIVTGVRNPAELGIPALPPQPPAGDAPAKWNFTAVIGVPLAVSFGPNPPVPLILHATDPVACGSAAPLTPSPTTVTVAMDSMKTAPIHNSLR